MKGGKRVKLSDAYWFQEGPGVRNTQFRDSGIKLLNVANITKAGVLDLAKTNRHLDPDEVSKKYPHFLIDSGDLVIASSGISIDTDGLLRTRGAFVTPAHLPLCMNTSTIRFKARENISDLSFLRYWLGSLEFRAQITRLVTGSAQKNFGPSHLNQLEITLPSMAEQRRIASILNKVESLLAKRIESKNILLKAPLAIFDQLVGKNGRDVEQVKMHKLGDLITIRSGGTPDKSRSEFWNGAIPWVSPKDMKPREIWVSEDHITQLALSETALKQIPEQSVLIVVRGMILAHTVPIRLTCRDVTINQDMKALIPKLGLDPIFLRWALETIHADILSSVSTASHGTKRLETDILLQFQIPVPPRDVQAKFSAAVKKVEELNRKIDASEGELHRLFKTLQHQFFDGGDFVNELLIKVPAHV